MATERTQIRVLIPIMENYQAMTEAQISQLIGILGVLVTTLNAFVLFWIANHQRGVAATLKEQNGKLNDTLQKISGPGQ